jgi:hypothetical protein
MAAESPHEERVRAKMTTPVAIVVAGALIAVAIVVAVLILDEQSACEQWQAEFEAVANERDITPAELWSTYINVEALSGIDVSEASVSERASGCALPD